MAKFAQLALEDLRPRPTSPTRIAPYRAGYTAAAAARARAPARRRASCSASSPPTRSSSASTSARSTPRSASPSPAPSPRCARCGAAPGAAGAASRSTSRARTRSTSSSAATPTSSSTARSRRRSSTTRTSRSTPRTCSAPRTRGRSTPPTTPTSRPELAAHGRACWSPRASCASGRTGTYVPRRAEGYPAADVSLRSAGRDAFAIVDTGSGELLGTVEAARAHTRRRTRARSTCTAGAPTRSPRSTSSARRALVQPVRGRLVHAAQARDRHAHRAAARPPRDAGRDAVLRHRRGHRAGASPTSASGCPTTRRSTSIALDLPADLVHDAGALVRAGGPDGLAASCR